MLEKKKKNSNKVAISEIRTHREVKEQLERGGIPWILKRARWKLGQS